MVVTQSQRGQEELSEHEREDHGSVEELGAIKAVLRLESGKVASWKPWSLTEPIVSES